MEGGLKRKVVLYFQHNITSKKVASYHTFLNYNCVAMTKICDHGHGHGGAFAPQQPMNALGIVKRPVDYLRDYPDSCRRRLATKLNFRPPNFALRADLASQLNGASDAVGAKLVAPAEVSF